MRRALGRVTVIVALAGAAGPVGAQEQRELEPVVVTATKIETPATEVGASVSVVTEQDFRTYHYPTLDEALRSVPGVEIRRSGGFGKTSSLSIRGANPNQVQVLVDGVRVKSTTTGLFDLSDLSPDLIERIEVIRGPQSTLYGADAIGGVVNIITKKGRGPFGASVEQQAGNYDTLRSVVAASGAYRIFDYAVSGSHFESNGQFTNDGTDQNAANLRLGLTLPLQSSLAFALRWNKSNIGAPVRGVFGRPQPDDPIIDQNARQQSETTVMTLSGQTRPIEWWESVLRLSRFENALGFQDPPDPGFTTDVLTRSQIDVERREAEWLNHFHLGTWSTSSVGLEYRHEEGENKGTFRRATHTPAVFFQQQFRFFERLFMSAGFRTEDNSVFGTETTERGALSYLISGWGTRLRGGAGSGFRAPAFNELFFPDFGNPALKPERSFSYDFGVDQRLWRERIRLGLTYFRNDFRDLITCCVPIPSAPFGGPINVGRARSAGIEFTSEIDLLRNLVAGLNYTYTDTRALGTGRPLPREPHHRGNVTLTWEPTTRSSLFGQVHIVDRQFEPIGEVYNSGHTRVDVGGTYRLLNRYAFIQSVDLTARIQNLLNEDYAEVRGFPALGITGWLGLRTTF